MSENEARDRDPAHDPAVRRRVQRSLDQVLHTARDVAARYSDHQGHYAAPDPVGDIGDVTGLIAAGHNQVIKQLQAALDEARRVMDEVYDELDEHKRRQLGDGWNPAARHFQRN
jgi:hypothetical protein